MNNPQRVSIVNGRVIDPANRVDQVLDLHIEGRHILALGVQPRHFTPDTTIEARDLIVCPGLVDLSARLREPGHEHKATLSTETRAAASAGITTLCCPPDTNPVIDTPAMVTLVQERAQRLAHARVLPIGALTKNLDGEHLSEMAALQQAGCAALSNAERPLANTLVERRALEYAATFGIRVMLRSEDQHLRNNGCAHEGPVASRLGLPGIPVAAETVAVARDLALAEQTLCPIHFRGLSSARAAQSVALARQQRLPVTADVAIHQMHLTEMDVDGFNSNCHVNPPLRGFNDRQALREALADGIIGAICSDHQPHDADAKEAPFPSTAPGVSALETLLPLTLKLASEGVLGLSDAIARVTCGPADILGLDLGRLTPGCSADICVFDPERHWELNRERMWSAGQNTPFHGWEFTGRVTHTLFEGKIVYMESRQNEK